MRRSAALMFPMIKAYQQGDQSAEIFCEQQDLPFSVFQYWQNKYNKQKQKSSIEKEFIPIQIESEVKSEVSTIELFSPSGIQIKITLS